MKKLLTLLVLVSIFAGCAKALDGKNDSDLYEESDTESYTYELEENGCNTGKQEFNSLTEMCRGLRDNDLNNNCAYRMRESYFKSQCQGQTFSTFSLETEEYESSQEAPTEY